MNAIRSISIQAPTIETLELLVEGACVADLALASTPRLDGVVGDWGAFRSVEVAVETATFHTLDGFAAMDFGLVLQPASGMPTLVTVTVTASTIGGAPRIITVDRAPAYGEGPLGSRTNPVVVEGIAEHDPAEDAAVVFVLGLEMLDIAHLSSPMLDMAIGGFNHRESAWNHIGDASLSPIRGTLTETPDHVEIDAVLTLKGSFGAHATHDVVVRMRRCEDDLHFAGLALRSVRGATGTAAPGTVHVANADPRGEALVEAVEKLDHTSIWPFSTFEVDNAIGHWSEVLNAFIVTDCGTLTLDDDYVSITGTLKAVTIHGDRIERPVLVTINEPSDQHATPEIGLLP